MIMPDLAFDLRHLQYALTVAEHGSFRRAADVLNLSQSTVSRRVQTLECRLGIPLFERTRSGTRPTPAGERFMRAAAVGAEQLRQAISEIAQVQRGNAGELKIGLMASLASGFLADLFETYHRQFPNVDVKVEEGTSQAIAAGVLNGRLDAAFVLGEPGLPGCETRALWDEPLFVALPRRHQLTEGSSVAWGQIRDETFLVAANAHGPEVERIIIRQLSSLGFRPRISIQGVGRENLMNMVAKGFGLTVVASSTLGTDYPGVSFLPLKPATEVVRSSIVWSVSNMNPALKRLLELSTMLANRKAVVRADSGTLEAAN